MPRRTVVMIVVAVVLGSLYAVYFTDWFAKSTIEILYQVRPPQPQYRDGGRSGRYGRYADLMLNPVAFTLNGKYNLTLIKVVPAKEFATNRYVKPLWHLMSTSNSAPTKAIIYGRPIQGMKPVVSGLRPEPLETGKNYLLIVESGRTKGQVVFKTRGAPKSEPDRS